MRHVIVGGGVAGTTAAEAIRKRDPEASITILTDEPFPLWSKIRLPELFSGHVDAEGLLVRRPPWYERLDIDLRTGERVASIEPERKVVVTEKGEEVPYDRLLLATGGNPYVPPIPGSDLENVYTVRKLREATEVYQRLQGIRRIVIIGGGTLGLELARNLLELKAEVHVVESHHRLLPKLTDPAASEMLHLRLDQLGIHIHHECETKEIAGEGGKAERVLIEDGRVLPCDAVIIAAGMRAEKTLGVALGMAEERGIVVDDHMRTSVPDIYAAGDVAEHNHVKYGAWRAAEEQGMYAGANMAGDEMVYKGTVMSKYVRVAGADVFSAGDLDWDRLESVLQVEWEEMVYKRVVLDDCRIVGSVMVGDLRDAQRVLRAIDTGMDVCAHMESLREWDLSFVPRTVIGNK